MLRPIRMDYNDCLKQSFYWKKQTYKNIFFKNSRLQINVFINEVLILLYKKILKQLKSV